jgi:Na+:H+ antiporter, NhaA family
MKATNLFTGFFNSKKAGGIVLVLATAISLFVANSAAAGNYTGFWNQPIGSHSLTHWINDGLMAIFFLLIGLELEREIFIGELSDLKTASLPIFGAIGGMVVPATIFLLLNFGTPMQAGAGIPMATDIAFAVGILSLLGNRVPLALKVFLTALAVIDDLGAILVIAIFYTDDLSITNLGIALGIWVILFVLGKTLKVRNLFPYLIGGVAMWYFMLQSGVHATISGVLLAFAIPFGDGTEKATSYRLQHFLHKPVAFVILPLFALANTCIPIQSGWQENLLATSSIGIIAGLVIGKPLGIWLFSYLSSKAGFCQLPSGVNWNQILATGFLGGIGFTMSIFIALLAYDDLALIDDSKIAILAASFAAGTIGYIMLKVVLRKQSGTRLTEDD